MKSKLLLLAMFIGVSIFAQTGNVVVFSEAGELFYLTVNGVKFNEKAQANVKVEGMREPGFHAVITFENAALGSLSKNLMVTGGHELTYKLKNKKGKWKLVPFTDIPIEQAPVVACNPTIPVIYDQTPPVIDPITTSSNTTTTQPTTSPVNIVNPAVIDVSISTGTTGSTTNTTSVTSSTTTTGTVSGSQTTNSNVGGIGISLKIDIKDPIQTSTTTSQQAIAATNVYVDTVSHLNAEQNTQITTSQTTVEQANVATVASRSNCSTPMSSADFEAAKNSIASKPFTDTKLTVAKQVLNNHCVNTDQVKLLMGLFTGDDEKIELAKYAYDHTVDQKNYYRVNDAFTFSSSSEELDKYLQTK